MMEAGSSRSHKRTKTSHGDGGDRRRPPDDGRKSQFDIAKAAEKERKLRVERNKKRTFDTERINVERHAAQIEEIENRNDLMDEREEIYSAAYATIHYMRESQIDITGADSHNLDDNIQQYEDDRIDFNTQANTFNRDNNISQRRGLIRDFNRRIAEHNERLIDENNRVEEVPMPSAVPRIDHSFRDLYDAS